MSWMVISKVNAFPVRLISKITLRLDRIKVKVKLS